MIKPRDFHLGIRKTEFHKMYVYGIVQRDIRVLEVRSSQEYFIFDMPIDTAV